MAHYHASVKSGPKGTGAEHAQYIGREGRFKVPRYGEIGEKESGNLPAWAKGSAARFFAAADEYERANGSAYREFELALPKELSNLERGQLVREFVAEQIGERHAYAWAIHEPQGENPHVHIMFSERTRDGIEREKELYFKRANLKTPERGGQAKSDRFSGGMVASERKAVLEEFRAQWASAQNRALERAGVEARVDHRSLEAQEIDREAMQHRGPALSGIEKRGKEADVSLRREAERAERAQAFEQERRAVAAEVRVVTREEMAAEKVAVRGRRALAAQVTGPEREPVLPRVEADRREQLERAQAQAERRIERRQGLHLGGELKEKLIAQARSLRERIGREMKRVKEWVRERFLDPVRQFKERAWERLSAAPAPTPAAPEKPAAGAPAIDWAAVKAQGRAASEGWRQELHRAQAEEQRVQHERQERERQRQAEADRVARARAAAEARRARSQVERQRTVEQFRELAARREMKSFGYGDQSDKWRATPPALREQIEQFNALAPAAREREIKRLMQEPQRLRGLQELLEQRRQQIKDLGRGIGD